MIVLGATFTDCSCVYWDVSPAPKTFHFQRCIYPISMWLHGVLSIFAMKTHISHYKLGKDPALSIAAGFSSLSSVRFNVVFKCLSFGWQENTILTIVSITRTGDRAIPRRAKETMSACFRACFYLRQENKIEVIAYIYNWFFPVLAIAWGYDKPQLGKHHLYYWEMISCSTGIKTRTSSMEWFKRCTYSIFFYDEYSQF